MKYYDLLTYNVLPGFHTPATRPYRDFWLEASKQRGSRLGDCPLNVEVSDHGFGHYKPHEIQYHLVGKLQVVGHGYEESIWEESSEPGVQMMVGGGSIIGDWTLALSLLDPERGEMLGEGSFRWTGTIDDVIVIRRIEDGPGVYVPYFAGYAHPLRDWVKSLMDGQPLDDRLHDYERTPETLDVTPDKLVVGAGEELSIRLSRIFGAQGRPSQAWQKVLVEVDRGEILNGTPQADGAYYAFDVGATNEVNVRYRAPDLCDVQTETIRVYNTCDVRHSRVGYLSGQGNCVYEIVGGKSPVNLRQEYCEKPSISERYPGCRPGGPKKSWFDQKHEVRISGGILDFRDHSLPPFRPIVWHRFEVVKHETATPDCYGRVTLRQTRGPKCTSKGKAA